MEPKELFKRALAQATEVVEIIGPDDYDQPTPDTEWDIRALVGHMLCELSWVADIVRGMTIEEVGNRYDGDLIGDDLAQSWTDAAQAALKAVEGGNLQSKAHLSYGDVSVRDYLSEAASDQLIHAWDLGTAIGVPVKFDAAVAQAVYKITLPKREGMRASGLFAKPKEVSDEADVQTKLLALYGRQSTKQ